MLKTAEHYEGLVVCVPALLIASLCVCKDLIALIRKFEGTQHLLQNESVAQGELRLAL